MSPRPEQAIGISGATAGDVNGDGLFSEAPQNNEGEWKVGKAYLILSPLQTQ